MYKIMSGTRDLHFYFPTAFEHPSIIKQRRS